MRIDILRHGDCADNVWLRGRTDSLLTEQGYEKMLSQLKTTDYQKVVTSPAKRCRDFAEGQFQDFEISDLWQERNYGIFDGLSHQQVEALYPEQLTAYLQQPFNYDLPQAETFAQFQQRVQQAWQELIESELNSELDSLLLITHGGPMRLLLQSILNLPNEALFHIEMGYAAMVSVKVFQTGDYECDLYSETFCKLLEIRQFSEN